MDKDAELDREVEERVSAIEEKVDSKILGFEEKVNTNVASLKENLDSTTEELQAKANEVFSDLEKYNSSVEDKISLAKSQLAETLKNISASVDTRKFAYLFHHFIQCLFIENSLIFS